MRFTVLIFLISSWITNLKGQDPISLTPNTGKRGNSFTVTISGVNTAFSVNSTTLARITKDTTKINIAGVASDATTFNGTLAISAQADTGKYDATIWQSTVNGTSWSCSKCFTVELNCNLTIDAEVTQIACFGDSTGRIKVTIQGATGATDLVWNTGDTTNELTNLGPGGYGVTVTDAEGCSSSQFITIIQPSQVNALTFRGDITFFNGNDGKANVMPQGGMPPYTIVWSNGVTGETILNVSPGTYTYTVTDSRGCTYVGSEQFLNFNCTIQDSIAKVDLACFGDTYGSATIFTSFGNAPFTYFWSNGATTSTATGLGVGQYFVTVTDFRKCPLMDSIDIFEPEPLAIGFMTNGITRVGIPDGQITAFPTGGSGLYTLSWSSGSTGTSLNSLTPGVYTVTVTDGNGCSTTGSSTVADIDCSGLLVTIDEISDTLGTITTMVTGGVGDLLYQWLKDGIIVDSVPDLTGAKPGTYIIQVWDGRGCTAKDTVTLKSTGTMDARLSVQTRIFPNPANGSFHIHWPAVMLGAQVDIFDLHGQRRYAQPVTALTQTINTRDWPAGLYILRGVQPGTLITKKIQVTH